MTIQLKDELIGWDGKPIVFENGLTATLGRVICLAVVGPEQGLSEEEIEKRFAFAAELAGLDEYNLGSKQLALVRARIRSHFPAPGLAGPALRMLEVKDKDAKADAAT
jgi:hypothetical protein